jgi:hypothetical protein
MLCNKITVIFPEQIFLSPKEIGKSPKDSLQKCKK